MITPIYCEDQTDVASTCAEDVVSVIQSITEDASDLHGDGVARIVLTGGGAGVECLQRIHQRTEAADHPIDWSRVHVFFGDERWVPADDPERNERQAREALLSHVNIPAENIHSYAVPTSGDANNPSEEELAQAVSDYTEILNDYAPQGFDIHLLGMGPEGHINSLFPHTTEIAENSKLVAAVRDCPKPPPTRITLTLPAVNRSNHVWLLVAGAAKAEAAGHVINQDSSAAEWPASGVRGRLSTRIYVDKAAAQS